MFSFTIWDLYIQFNSLVCVRTRVCYRVSVFCSQCAYLYKQNFSLCKGMQCQLEMCVLLKLRHSKIPSVFLSLSLSLFFNFIVLCPIYYYNHFWVFFDLRCTKLFYGQLLNLYVFITINCVLGIFYFVNLSHFVE